MIGLEFLRHGNRFAARVHRHYFSAERSGQPEIRLGSQAREEEASNRR